jgi:hypothetical protein
MIGANYIAIGKNEEPNSVDTEAAMQKTSGAECTIPRNSPHSFVCDFGKRKYRLDRSDSVFRRVCYGKRGVAGSVKKGNDDRKILRGNSVALVIQNMLCFMGAGHHFAGTDSGLTIGGYCSMQPGDGGSINMPYLKLDKAPANIETMYARTMLAVSTNSKNHQLCGRVRMGVSVQLLTNSAMAWRHDTVMGNKMKTNRWETNQKMDLFFRSSSLYDNSPSTEKDEFGSTIDHMKSETNRLFTDSLCEFFRTQGAGTRFAVKNMIGKGTVEFQSHTINQANQGPEVETDIHRNKVAFAETGVWLIKNPVSRQLHDEIIKEVNRLPFIGSSQDVGANTKKTQVLPNVDKEQERRTVAVIFRFTATGVSTYRTDGNQIDRFGVQYNGGTRPGGFTSQSWQNNVPMGT